MSMMSGTPPPSIYDIRQLQALKDVAREFEVDFKLHGGVPFRLAVRSHSPAPRRETDRGLFDLFDLTPFTSDIDLLHSGSPAVHQRIVERILREVPHADCFRWEIRPEASQDVFRRAAEHSNSIPARQLELTARGFHDPAGGLQDIAKRKFRYVRGDSFRDSPLVKQDRDVGLFSALLYLQTLFEAGFAPEDIPQPGLVDILFIFRGVREEGEDREADHLPLPEELRVYVRQSVPPPLALSSSAWLGGDQTRLPFATAHWDAASAPQRFAVCAQAIGKLAANQMPLMVSSCIGVTEGDATSSRTPVGSMEFVYFALPDDDAFANYSEVDLSALVAIRQTPPAAGTVASSLLLAAQQPLAVAGQWIERTLASLAPVGATVLGSQPEWSIFCVPCIVQRPRGHRKDLFIRINMLGLLNGLARWSGAEAQFFLRACRLPAA